MDFDLLSSDQGSIEHTRAATVTESDISTAIAGFEEAACTLALEGSVAGSDSSAGSARTS